MEEPTVELDLTQLIKNVRGEAVKDMIDPPLNTTRENAPDLTYGSLIANAIMIGIASPNKKDAEKYFRMAGVIEKAVESDGKLEYNRNQLNELEQAWGKVTQSAFQTPMYSGAIQCMIEDAKTDLREIEKNLQKKSIPEKPSTS